MCRPTFCFIVMWLFSCVLLNWGAAQEDITLLEEKAIQAAVEKISPSVVQLETIGGLSRVGDTPVGTGPFTAVVLDTDGYLLSSAFNFIHQPSAIFVRLPSGERVAAERVADDKSRKLTLLKIEPDNDLVPIELARPADMLVGQTTIAVGRVYDIQSPNVSVGILSATDRIWGRAVQTDAKISPANFGGPLINLRGQVMGLLTPHSPDSDELTAGSQWYDSGIGFAVPLDPVLKRLEDLKSGNDLVAGKLGVSLEGSNIYSGSAKIAFCQGASPAAIAGVRTGDTIVEINGQPITRQAQMRHAIGPLYAGDRAQIKVKRNEEELSFEVTLAEEIKTFEPAALGILARNITEGDERSVQIDHLIPGEAAEKAGVLVGDTIVSLGGQMIESTDDLGQAVLAVIGSPTNIEVSRQGVLKQLPITLLSQTAAPVREWIPPAAASTRVLEIKVPEFANRSFALVPEGSADTPAPALLVWVALPGKMDQQAYVEEWTAHVQENHVCVLVVQSTGKKSWMPGEAEFIRRAVDLLRNQVPFGEDRVVAAGSEAGGSMAALTAFKYRDLFRGLATLDTVVSQRLPGMETSAVNPMLIYFAFSGDRTKNEEIENLSSFLAEKKFPYHIEQNGPRKPGDWAGQLLHWVQTVNRL